MDAHFQTGWDRSLAISLAYGAQPGRVVVGHYRGDKMLKFAKPDNGACPVHILSPETLESWLDKATPAQAGWARATGFMANSAEICLIPDEGGGIAAALAGLGNTKAQSRQRFTMAGIAAKLPAGLYRIATSHDARHLEEHALGWLLSAYRFDRYKPGKDAPRAQLICPEGCDATRLEAIAQGEALIRDLINTPTNDMGPAELEQAARDLAGRCGAQVEVITGDALLAQNFPLIHTVGRASASPPRLIDLRWGKTGPTLCLVGKGVCFDTGGLNIKPAGSMGLMKKDMGGSATVLGLASMIMALEMPVQLRVLIPAVENAIDGSAFRPQDVLTSRKGLTVEINNTDAEGRLVLADALALADETPPDLMICMATLTGAARVALGPGLSPFYTDDATLATALSAAGEAVRDPVWRMPFHDPYEPMIEPQIADLDNAPKGGFAGSITAALFLRRFVEETPRFMHFDIYGWTPNAAPGFPVGGSGHGARALLEALPAMLKL